MKKAYTKPMIAAERLSIKNLVGTICARVVWTSEDMNQFPIFHPDNSDGIVVTLGNGFDCYAYDGLQWNFANGKDYPSYTSICDSSRPFNPSGGPTYGFSCYHGPMDSIMWEEGSLHWS